MYIYLLTNQLIACLALYLLFISSLTAQIQHHLWEVQLPVPLSLETSKSQHFSEIVYRILPASSDLNQRDHPSSALSCQELIRVDKQKYFDVQSLREALSVIKKEIKFKLITTTYFSQLSNQSPWDIDQNTRNLLLGLPACAPSQSSFAAPKLQLRDRQLSF